MILPERPSPRSSSSSADALNPATCSRLLLFGSCGSAWTRTRTPPGEIHADRRVADLHNRIGRVELHGDLRVDRWRARLPGRFGAYRGRRPTRDHRDGYADRRRHRWPRAPFDSGKHEALLPGARQTDTATFEHHVRRANHIHPATE
nr:hypothetical protein GCM10017745_51220 [Saccharothrix mutabilis subsp. capreolus]